MRFDPTQQLENGVANRRPDLSLEKDGVATEASWKAMRTAIIAAVCFMIFSLSLHAGDLIPIFRRTRTRCRTSIPKAEYQTRARSRSVSAVSRRAVLMQNQLALTGGTPEEDLADRIDVLDLDDTASPTDILPQPSPPPAPGTGSPSPDPNTAGSSVADDIETLAEVAEAVPTVKLFQFREPNLQIDHCSISQMAVVIQSDGRWVVSLRADQNRRAADRRHNPALFLKQNQFVVNVRCFGAFRTRSFRRIPTSGRPVLLNLGPIEFTVKNGQPYSLRASNETFVPNDSLQDGTTAPAESSVVGAATALRSAFDVSVFEPTIVEAEIQSALIQANFDQIDRVEIEFFYRGGSNAAALVNGINR